MDKQAILPNLMNHILDILAIQNFETKTTLLLKHTFSLRNFPVTVV